MQLHTFRYLALSIALLLLTGCAATGNGQVTKLEASNAPDFLVPKKTTKAEVTKLLGEAKVVTYLNGDPNEIWIYRYDENFSKGLMYLPYVALFSKSLNYHGKELAILFDRNGVLKKYRFSNADKTTNQ